MRHWMGVLGGFALPMAVGCGPAVAPIVYDPDAHDESSSGGDDPPGTSVTLGTTANGTTDATTDPTTADSTGEAPSRCGDEVLDPGEECDDGNDELVDGCEADCRFSPGTILWTRSVDGGASINDFATSVAVGATGMIYATGAMQSGAGANAWLGVFDLDGDPVRELVFDDEGDEVANSVVLADSGTVWVVGQDLDDDRALLLREADGVLVQEAGGGAHEVPFPTRGVAAAGGGLFTSRQEWSEMGWTYAIDLRDAFGIPIWTVQEPTEALVSAMVATPEGGVVLAGQIDGETGHAQVWLRELDGDGNTLWTYADDFVDHDAESLNTVILSEDGTLLAGGQRSIPAFGYVPFILELDRAGALVDLRDISIGAASFWLYALVEDADGLVVGGAAYPDNTPSDAVVAALDDAGMLRWGSSYDDALGFNDSARAVVRDPTTGDLVAVGTDVASGQGDNVWIARVRG